jgi:hypothetical protein
MTTPIRAALEELVEELRPNCGKLRDVHGPLMGLGYAAALDDILLAADQPTPPAPDEALRALAGICIEPRAGEGICGHTERWYGHGEPMPPEFVGPHLFRALAAQPPAPSLDVEALARFMEQHHPRGVEDWACAECMAARGWHSDLIKPGWRCAPHAALAARQEGQA